MSPVLGRPDSVPKKPDLFSSGFRPAPGLLGVTNDAASTRTVTRYNRFTGELETVRRMRPIRERIAEARREEARKAAKKGNR